MSNIFTYFTVNLPLSSCDVSTAISNLLQTTTTRWRHESHSTFVEVSRVFFLLSDVTLMSKCI